MLQSIILRFRDPDIGGSVIDTIAEHDSVIEARGFVWWGWWRKETEPDRRSELEELTALLDEDNRHLGLYDRDTGRFFFADASKCYSNPEEPMPSPGPGETPTYYREERVAAWFKLHSIEPVTRSRFVEYFSDVPVGNSTLYAVVTEGNGPRVLSPELMGEEISVDGHSILHLSDLHFGDDFGFPLAPENGRRPLLEVLKHDLELLEGLRIGVLVVSGDFTTRVDGTALLAGALEFLRGLSSELGLEKDQVILVPGNHDIALRDYKPHNYQHEVLMTNFLSGFYGRELSDFLSLRRFRLPNGQRLEVLTMNSVRLRTKELMKYGFVQWQIYDDFLRKHPAIPGVRRCAVMHHHLVPVPSEEQVDPSYPEAGLSVTLDAGAVIEGLQRHGFDFVLHGHQHLPGVARVARGWVPHDALELAGLEKTLHLVACGTTGAKRYSEKLAANSYTLLEVDGPRLRVRTRQFTPTTNPRDFFRGVLTLD